MENRVVFGIYESRDSVENAVSVLKENGFRMSDISVLLPQDGRSQDFFQTKAPEGAATGAGTGAIIGGALGLLAGAGALAIPGVGPFIVAGPIVSALAGAGVGGAVGVLGGALIGLGIPEYDAKRYEVYIKEGGILMTVHADDSEWAEEARRFLEETGAQKLSITEEVESNVKVNFQVSKKSSEINKSKNIY